MSSRERPLAAIGVVLAGGLGSRLGGDKGVVELAGRSLASYPVEAMRAAGLEPLLVAKPDSVLPELDCPVLREPPQPRHPLCGILAALRVAGDRAVVVCGCDMPFVEPPLLAHLARLDTALAVAEVADRLHPLLGRYEPALRGALEEQLRRQAPLMEVITTLRAQIVDERELARFGDPERICFNVNTHADLERAESLLNHRSRSSSAEVGESPGRPRGA